MNKNEFFGINKFPKGWGMIVMPISMARIATGQTAQKCIDWILDFGINKVVEPKIGLNFVYADFLYLYSDEKANILKERFMIEIIKHKNAMQNLIQKNKQSLQIQHAFSFQTWNDLYISTRDFDGDLRKVRQVYKDDPEFQKYVAEDVTHYKRGEDDNQINFFLEEYLAAYLLIHKQIHLRNEYTLNREEWLLWMYPGTPPKGLVYLCQKNPFNFTSDNPYLGQYNLENGKFYDFNRLDLQTWDYL
jgi:hypothetical protein